MKFKLKLRHEIEAWHWWFAWYPVRIKSEFSTLSTLVWLEWVERRTPFLRNAGVGLNGPLPTEYRQ